MPRLLQLVDLVGHLLSPQITWIAGDIEDLKVMSL
jgi:hypothetical protein